MTLRQLFLSLSFGAALLTAAPSDAQTAAPALLVADSVTVENGSRLVASGNVEVLQDGTRLTATGISFDNDTGALAITGPIRIVTADGTILTATEATLDRDLRNGLLAGARMVLDQQLQLAAAAARRVDGRYTQLSRVAVTSCQVCANNPTPLWQIRAKRVIHDEVERQLYFDEAQLRVLDVPVFYLPRMRLPDPTLKRARGFLIPRVRSSSTLGFGIKLPYFIPIGDHQDITLTPYLSEHSRTLEYRYRRAYHNGDISVFGAFSFDTLDPVGVTKDDMRGYAVVRGAFDLPHDFKLSFDLHAVSDIAYRNDYGLGEKDRLDSPITLTRTKRDSLTRANLVHYQSLRASEDNDTQPTVIANLTHEYRMFPQLWGGEFRASAALHGHFRWSSLPVDGSDPDTEVDGRDVGRLHGEMSWRKRWTLGAGLRAGLSTHLWMDRVMTRQDASSPRSTAQAVPGVAAELRLPMVRRSPNGGRSLLEPIAMMGWTGGSRAANPNDESTRAEFDEGNLLSLSRFPADDRREHGLSTVAGLRWMHRGAAGWTAGLSMGRVWRQDSDTDFTRSSGLAGLQSDWLLAGQWLHPAGLSISARGLLDDETRLTKAEGRVGYTDGRYDISASYLLLTTDLAEDRPTAQSEWSFDGGYQVNDRWATSLSARYDLADQRLDRAGLGLQYQNECVQIDLSASRKFASATNLEPSTDFDLSVALKGFSTGGSAKEYRRTCAQ